MWGFLEKLFIYLEVVHVPKFEGCENWEIFFGFQNVPPDALANMLSVLLKQYLYQSQCFDKKHCTMEFMTEISSLKNTEKIWYKSQGQIGKFNIK